MMRFFWWLKVPMYWWVSSKVIPPSAKDVLGDDFSKVPTVYVLKSKSITDQIVLDHHARKDGLPIPKGHIKPLLTGRYRNRVQAIGSVIYLTKLGLLQMARIRAKKIPSPLVNLVAHASATRSFDAKLIPISIFWGRNPGNEERSLLKLLFFDDDHAGILQKIFIVMFQGKQCFISYGKPISLREQVDEGAKRGETVADTAKKIRRVLRVHFSRQRTAALGPIIYDRAQGLRDIVKAKPVQDAIAEEARKKNLPAAKITKKALHYADEIAAQQSYSIVRFFDVLLSYVWNKIFAGVEIRGGDKFVELAKDHEIVFFQAHRSHMDYLLIGYSLYYLGQMPPHTAAGINLNFWPAGPILRRGGAFFLRRSFRGNRLYTAVFNEYVHFLLTRGHPLSFFPEGGRSRTGKLLQPKTGMLAMVVQSYLRSQAKPIALVPVYIGYDKVMEVGTYIKELTGSTKKSESAGALFKARRALKNKFGKAYMGFGAPHLLHTFLDEHQPDWRQAYAKEGERPAWMSDRVNELAQEMMVAINSSAMLGAVPLVALALLSSPQRAMQEADLVEYGDLLLAIARRVVPDSERNILPETMTTMLHRAQLVTKIQRVKQSDGDVIFADEKESILLMYYRNNVMHLFAIPGLVASFFQNNDAFDEMELIDSCLSLHRIMRAELFLETGTDEQIKAKIAGTIELLVEMGLITRQGGGKLTRPPVTDRRFDHLKLMGRLLGQTFERYAVAVTVLAQRPEVALSKERFEDTCHTLAQRVSVLSGIVDPNFADKNLFGSLLDILKRLELVAGLPETTKQRCGVIAKTAAVLFSTDIRHSIERFVGQGSSATDTEPEARRG